MKNSSENKQRRDSHIITVGGWKSRKEESKLSELSGHEVESKYANYPLVRDMILNERIR